MGVTFIYTGGKPHKFSDRLKDMKHMVFQQEEYDLSTDEGKENTWHAVNAMLLGGTVSILGFWIGEKISEPFEKQRMEEMKRKAFQDGQIKAYQNILKDPAVLMDRSFDLIEKNPKKYAMKKF